MNTCLTLVKVSTNSASWNRETELFWMPKSSTLVHSTYLLSSFQKVVKFPSENSMLNVQDELAIHEYLHVKFGHKKHKDIDNASLKTCKYAEKYELFSPQPSLYIKTYHFIPFFMIWREYGRKPQKYYFLKERESERMMEYFARTQKNSTRYNATWHYGIFIIFITQLFLMSIFHLLTMLQPFSSYNIIFKKKFPSTDPILT